ncbi:MAG: hypothetical protein COV76_03495 [Candidatus Omnitrophica bacterium CG11_big_fil_rev_8_21_14_0_20_64_10]|nr:MAG: hypothetical protein COV76_03495 [Candidatus Omnitrophica bacterium CG11_big_fil_rev_8_21_14_0_20_64_10]
MNKKISSWRSQVTAFQRKVYEALLKIPRGKVVTYGELARRVGRPGGAQAVGQALKQNRWAPRIPCHRVVAARGLGGYSGPGGPAAKRRLLRKEGYIK